MERNCPDCEKDATLGARFCRTCGARLALETEVTAGDTKQYSPQQAAAAEYAAPPLIGADPFAPAPDTARLYQQPQPVYYPTEKPKRSWKAVWITLAVVIAMFIAGLAVVAVRVGQRFSRQPVIVHAPDRGIPGGIPAPPHPPNAPPPPGTASLTLEELKYPGAEIVNEVTVVGQEVLKMTTEDEMSEVRDHYRELLGAQIELENRSDDSVVLKTLGEFPTVIKLERFSQELPKVLITIVRTGLPSLDNLFRQKKPGETGPAPPVPADIQRQIQDAMRQAQEAMRQAEEAKRQAERQRQP